MIIVLDNDGRAMAAAEVVTLFADHGILNPGPADEAGNIWEGERLLYINDSMETVELEELPAPWVPGAYLFVDGALVLDAESSYWKGYQEAEAARIAATVPQEVTRRKGLQALFLAGVSEAMIEAELAKLPTPQKELAQIEFRTSQTFQRNRPLVVQMGAALGLNLDVLFRTADALP